MQYGGMFGIHPRSTSSGGSTGGGVSLSGDELLQAQRLMHYKTYGEESYVFQHKDVWESLLPSFVAINDVAMSTLAMNFALEQGGHVGNYIGGIYGMPAIESGWSNLSTVDDIVDDLSAVEAGLNHATFSETMARLIVANKPIDEIDVLEEYKAIITSSLYGTTNKKVGTSYGHPALLISGEGVANNDIFYLSSTPCHNSAFSGYYWIGLDDVRHNLASGAGKEVPVNGGYTGYSNQTFLEINAVVRSLPTISHTHTYISTDHRTTATAKHTYIPLYFEG